MNGVIVIFIDQNYDVFDNSYFVIWTRFRKITQFRGAIILTTVVNIASCSGKTLEKILRKTNNKSQFKQALNVLLIFNTV